MPAAAPIGAPRASLKRRKAREASGRQADARFTIVPALTLSQRRKQSNLFKFPGVCLEVLASLTTMYKRKLLSGKHAPLEAKDMTSPFAAVVRAAKRKLPAPADDDSANDASSSVTPVKSPKKH